MLRWIERRARGGGDLFDLLLLEHRHQLIVNDLHALQQRARIGLGRIDRQARARNCRSPEATP